LIKLKELLQQKSNLDECTIVGAKLNGDIVLAKNRDRNYYPKIKIVHELINDVEVAYMLDMDTDYSEGMNEHGIGIINATLVIDKDTEFLGVERRFDKDYDAKIKINVQYEHT